jgi:hypothetical protein
MDIIQAALTRESLAYARFDGTMDLKKRQAAIKAFKDPNGPDGRPRPMVLLISLKAGGVGLNLTNANYAFMVNGSPPPVHSAGEFTDRVLGFPRWIVGGTRRWKVKVSRLGPTAIYARVHPTTIIAIDRLHRVTQERTVYVKHFVVRYHHTPLSGGTTLTLLFPRSETQSRAESFKSRNARPRSLRRRSKGKGRVGRAKNTTRRAWRI